MIFHGKILLLSWICYFLLIFGLHSTTVFWLKIEHFCERAECTSTIALQACLIPFFSILTLYHLKINCREGLKENMHGLVGTPPGLTQISQKQLQVSPNGFGSP